MPQGTVLQWSLAAPIGYGNPVQREYPVSYLILACVDLKGYRTGADGFFIHGLDSKIPANRLSPFEYPAVASF